jgi:hypothetical protein
MVIKSGDRHAQRPPPQRLRSSRQLVLVTLILVTTREKYDQAVSRQEEQRGGTPYGYEALDDRRRAFSLPTDIRVKSKCRRFAP